MLAPRSKEFIGGQDCYAVLKLNTYIIIYYSKPSRAKWAMSLFVLPLDGWGGMSMVEAQR